MQDGSRRRARLILIVGVLLAVIAGAGTFFYASSAQSAAPPPAVPTVAVLVAAREIPAKTTLTAADVRLQQFNVDAKPASALAKADEAVGQITVQNISVGEPILPGKFSDPKKPSFVVMPPDLIGPNGAPAADSPNYRAISITVPDANAVGGAVEVGDIVDLVYTVQLDPARFYTPAKPDQTQDFSAKILLERVPILARLLTVYTIRVDALTAERLAYLQASGGQLQLLLRAPKDERATGSTGTTFTQIQDAFKIRVPEKIKQ